MSVRDGNLSILDEVHRWALFISLDDETVREASVDSHEFVERDFAYYQRYRTEREEKRAQQLAQYHRQRERLDEDDREDRAKIRQLDDGLRRLGLRADGETHARMES
ncbi:hypothetical protein OAX78_04250, partial [Planctomycetota bacterium]|nr:hypothetical protein [Planctomycetota bacterium]